MSNLDFWRKNSMDLNQVFENFLKSDSLSSWTPQVEKVLAAKCEISEGPQTYTLKFEIPGLKKEDIKIDLHDNRLTVSGEKREEKREEKDKKLHYSEVSYGSFMRSYTFPNKVDAEKVEASYDSGVLKVEVAKAASSAARQISIK
jgi:HSP20 family protein